MNKSKYPIYVISKNRVDVCYTAKFLIKDDMDFKLVVEPQEAQKYKSKFGENRVLILPFSNLGKGSIPARNWCWEHAKKKMIIFILFIEHTKVKELDVNHYQLLNVLKILQTDMKMWQ
jgi:hypothetical protein